MITQQQSKPQALTSNVSTATFSSMSKQAESLVSGGNNVLLNNIVKYPINTNIYPIFPISADNKPYIHI